MKGSTYRRCYCRGEDGKALGSGCPKLSSRRHGVYAVRQELPARGDGTRRSFSRSGYETAKDATAALDRVRALLDLPDHNDSEAQISLGDLLEEISKDPRAPLPEVAETRRRLNLGVSLSSRLTVGEWLDTWLASKRTKKKTITGYESIVRVHLKPGLGHLRLDRLNVGHLDDFFAAINERNETIVAENQARREQEARARWGRRSRPPGRERERLIEERRKLAAMPPYRKPAGAATQQRIRACLRAALNAAIARQTETGLTFNAAQYVELSGGSRPKPVLWTDEHIARWRETGLKPSPVMVWTPPQIGRFLDQAEGHRLYAYYHLIAFRGLRRGEGVGQAWTDMDLDKGLMTVSTEIVLDGWTPVETDLKTDGSAAVIALDDVTVEVLRAHRARQAAEKKAGDKWVETGKVFTTETGEWLHPDEVTDIFIALSEEAGLPPINLRDLRHVAATLIHAGGGDLHAIKETLRHSTIKLASDTYTSLLPEVDRDIANRAAAVVPRARKAPDEAPADGKKEDREE
ncbi:site-specific integrase [Streptomyces sp. NBC_01775]|uniref:site-specific integrase n=1 Tax=Streptomyces sp. NBC_01775 TaxID=2975939 RepID=UPI002DDBE45E|nr:site-specific integrase [Streptomyces sp. NBC_01775]WSB78298.1 site-specific integrase [Streptomyces sp. NBC_01775]